MALKLAGTSSQDSAQLACSGSDVHALYRIGTTLYYRKSADGGKTFGTRLTLATSAGIGRIAADGNLVCVSTWATANQQINLIKSTDGGVSFQTMAMQGAFGLYPRVYLNNGTAQILYLAGTDVMFTDGSTPVKIGTSNSPDFELSGNVASWAQSGDIYTRRLGQVPVNVSHNVGISTVPTMTVKGSHVYVCWQDTISSGLANNEILFAASADGGQTFTNPLNISNSTVNSTRNRIAANNNGTVLIAWTEAGVNNLDDVWIARSTDYGATWTKRNLSANGKGSVDCQLVFLDDNTVAAVWSDSSFASYSEIVGTFSTDAGATWQPVTNMSKSSGASYFLLNAFKMRDGFITACNGSVFAIYYDSTSTLNGIYVAGLAIGSTVPPSDTTKPIVTINKPEDKETKLPYQLNIIGTASDNVGVTSIIVEVDNVNVAVIGTLNWIASVTLNSFGSHTIVATARDAAGNSSKPASRTCTLTKIEEAQAVWT